LTRCFGYASLALFYISGDTFFCFERERPKRLRSIYFFSGDVTDTRGTRHRKKIINLPSYIANKLSENSPKKQSRISSSPLDTEDLQALAPPAPPGTKPLVVMAVIIPTSRSKIFQ
jgi:hypothetical protein